ncbi:hypothetical protein BP5796_02734 [Coleophoma crateriformis]|uniref:Non-haem dioxygenase N-terminal domain-containing protein n=1 Tax=Coleophoma crateriformis TaxID=565419 RepID=A0A3D8SZ93_9HELO|nr:hypothetical protein BP5796_02734 [Coleophoma crateriformis]
MATLQTAPAPSPASTTEFTSFSGNKRTLTSNVARRATASEIPTISLQAPHGEILRALRDACTRVGFFYISDTGVPPEVIGEAFETARRFFAQPDDEKMRVFFKKSRILRGYEPPARVRTDESKLPDLNEAFNWGYERGLDPMVEETDDEKGEPHAHARAAADPALRGGARPIGGALRQAGADPRGDVPTDPLPAASRDAEHRPGTGDRGAHGHRVLHDPMPGPGPDGVGAADPERGGRVAAGTARGGDVRGQHRGYAGAVDERCVYQYGASRAERQWAGALLDSVLLWRGLCGGDPDAGDVSAARRDGEV